MSDTLRIVLVDDNPDDRALVIRELRREFPALEVVQIIDNDGFSKVLAEDKFDLVITDYQLQWTTGSEILQAVKKLVPTCPVIMFTGTGSEEIAVAAIKGGLDDYVLKSPQHFGRLPGAVRLAVQTAHQRRVIVEDAEEFNRAVLNSLTAYIAVLDRQGDIIAVNEAWSQYAHDSSDILLSHVGVGTNYLEICRRVTGAFAHDARQALEGIQAVLNGTRTTFTLEYSCPLPLDKRWFSLYITPLSRTRGGAVVSYIDITERKRAEEEVRQQGEFLYQSEKLATMGQLLAGVAHELNNPLSVVMGQAALLRQSVRNKSQMERAEKIVQAAERCARIVNNFLALARQRPPERHPVQVNTVVQEAVELPVEGVGGAEPVAVGGARILVVDDEPGIAGVLAEVLQLDGHAVETVGNGEAALEKLAVGEYDLILSDICMPDLDGPALYREVGRRHPGLLRRFIFLTGDIMSLESSQFLSQTSLPCLSKPFTMEMVRQVVHRALTDESER